MEVGARVEGGSEVASSLFILNAVDNDIKVRVLNCKLRQVFRDQREPSHFSLSLSFITAHLTNHFNSDVNHPAL